MTTEQRTFDDYREKHPNLNPEHVGVALALAAPADDDADTGLPAVLALGATILAGIMGFLGLCWWVLTGVVR